MTKHLVTVCITETNAVYVDDTRITNRSTKPWGAVKTLFETRVKDDSVINTLVKHGYTKLLSKIDTEPYMSQAKAVMEKPA